MVWFVVFVTLKWTYAWIDQLLFQSTKIVVVHSNKCNSWPGSVRLRRPCCWLNYDIFNSSKDLLTWQNFHLTKCIYLNQLNFFSQCKARRRCRNIASRSSSVVVLASTLGSPELERSHGKTVDIIFPVW